MSLELRNAVVWETPLSDPFFCAVRLQPLLARPGAVADQREAVAVVREKVGSFSKARV